MGGMTRSKSAGRLRVTHVDGAGATTNIAIAGIAVTDEILYVIHTSTKAAITTMVDISSEVSITSAGNIQLSSTATTNDLLIVFWSDNSPGAGDAQLKSMHNYRFSLVTGANASTNIAVADSQTDDTLVYVGFADVIAAIEVITDDTANCSFTSDGQLQSATDTSLGQLFVIWHSNSGISSPAKSKFNLKFEILAGAAAPDTNIAVSGIATSDKIYYAAVWTATAAVQSMADITSTVSITSAGNIQSTGATAAANTVFLIWQDNSEWST